MNISPEMQTLIESEVAKKESLLESQYKDHFNKLKDELYDTLKKFASEAIKKNVQLESIDKSCDKIYYKPIVDNIVSVLNGKGIKNTLTESISENTTETNSTLIDMQSTLMEAVKTIQDLRDMLEIHETIEASLSGMNKDIINTAINRFKNDPRYDKLSRDDFLKEVASYVTKLKDEKSAKSIQFESSDKDVDSLLSEANSLLESDNSTIATNKPVLDGKFKPNTKINIPKLKKTVLDEAYAMHNNEEDNQVDDNDPVNEFMRTWG